MNREIGGIGQSFNKKAAAMLLALGGVGCNGEGGSEAQSSGGIERETSTGSTTQISPAQEKKISGTIQAIGSYIQGSARLYDIHNPGRTCDEGETNSQGIWKYESNLEKCPEGTDLGVSVKGINSDSEEEQIVALDVSDEEKKEVQIANDITTTVVKGLSEDTGGGELEASSNSANTKKNNIELFAKVLGVKPEQMIRNYMEAGDDEFGEKLSAYTTLKEMMKLYSGKSESQIAQLILKTIKSRSIGGQNIQLFQEGRAELFIDKHSVFGETTLLDDLLNECVDNNSLLNSNGEEWKGYSKEMLTSILTLQFEAKDGVSREKYKKTAVTALLLLKKTLENQERGDTFQTEIQLQGLQLWLKTNGIFTSSENIFGQDTKIVVERNREKIIQQQLKAQRQEELQEKPKEEPQKELKEEPQKEPQEESQKEPQEKQKQASGEVSNSDNVVSCNNDFIYQISSSTEQSTERCQTEIGNAEKEEEKKLEFVTEIIPELDLRKEETTNTKLKIKLTNLNKNGGEFIIRGIPEGVSLELTDSQNIYYSHLDYQQGENMNNMSINAGIQILILSIQVGQEYLKQKQEKNETGKISEKIQLIFHNGEIDKNTGRRERKTFCVNRFFFIV